MGPSRPRDVGPVVHKDRNRECLYHLGGNLHEVSNRGVLPAHLDGGHPTLLRGAAGIDHASGIQQRWTGDREQT